MKLIHTMLALGAVVAACSAQDLPSEASDLKKWWKDQRTKAVEKAAAPFDRKYREELERLLEKKTKAGLLEEALAIKKEIEELDGPKVSDIVKELESKIVGTAWERESGSHLVTFFEDGKFTSEDRWKSANNISHGRWVVTGARTIQCMNTQYPGIITEISFNPAFSKMEARNIEDPNTPVKDSDRRFIGTSYVALKK